MPEDETETEPVTSPAWPTDEWVHVKDKSTGHQFPVRAELFNEEAHEKTGKSPYGHNGKPLPVKYFIAPDDFADSPANRGRPADSSKTKTVTAADPAPDTSGQTAEPDKEK